MFFSDAAYVPGVGDRTESTWLVSTPTANKVLAFLVSPPADPAGHSWQVRVAPAVDVGHGQPYGIGMTADGRHALVACGGYVSVIDVPTLTEVDTILTPGPVFDVGIPGQGWYAFAVGTDPEAVYVIDLRSNPRRVVGQLALGAGLGPVAATADGGLLIASGGSVLVL